MNYSRFLLYNLVGGFLWISSFLLLGYFFGSIPIVKNNLPLVMLGIVIVSVLPPIIELIRSKYGKKHEGV
jgi:membrane-associated protein